ncbi:MAG: hypothetical protein KKC79_07535 [Gammaproteobacteria bacterium]|nr:hypothetical protein [Gammaproteobacteria bacterium]MBU1444404.1 hypothetical protein [Gammaproteobacteria bacterium]MBU2285565.1 hypothetical protein [Gammaproteobacteria bacterium]MBU2408487.1 hypothetical protein [Gammaproteobacteria bacterium]
MDAQSWISALKEFDAEREDFPGEHVIVLGLGLLLLVATVRSGSLVKRGLFGAAAGALIGRAASGTGGAARVASLLQKWRV